MGKWLAFDPNPDSEYVKDAEYANQKLNSIMKNYKSKSEKSKLFHEHQKNIQIQKNLEANITQRRKINKNLLMAKLIKKKLHLVWKKLTN